MNGINRHATLTKNTSHRKITLIAALCVFGASSATISHSATMQDEENAASKSNRTVTPTNSSFTDRPPEDEIIYFLLPDRFNNGDPGNDQGGLPGGPLDHGFNPAHKGFYHGGDLKGLTDRLEYIQGLGATAIWLGPIYKNKPVQGSPGQQSAGYHGYWVTDFTDVDPHFGDKDALKNLVDQAHARNMKVYLDIITNHTADVIAYRECHAPNFAGQDKEKDGCPYRSIADYPYTTRGGVTGEPVNDGFLGDEPQHQTRENYATLIRNDYAYTPYIPNGEESTKNPSWLNNPQFYHNRGDTTFKGESSLYGDFAGLDDLMTEHPFVVQELTNIFKDWITEYRIDGFRIDTARHVNENFWRQFLPAIKDHAKSVGIPNFYMFGEVYALDPAALARFTRVGGFDQVLDFGFQTAVLDVLGRGKSTDRFDALLDADALYGAGANGGRTLPTFLGNHDMGRFSGMVKNLNPDISNAELFARTKLAHGLMMFMRGVPVIYSGDEQGFVSDGHDQQAREDMFPSQVEEYNDNKLLATDATTADSNFDDAHPLYRHIAKLAGLRRTHPALRHGVTKPRRTQTDGPIFVFSRFDPVTGQEYIIAANTGAKPQHINTTIDANSRTFQSLLGICPKATERTGTISLSIPPFDLILCQANESASFIGQ